jgi:hypothetical protein
MNTGQRLGLVLLYGVMAGNAVLMLRLFIQILFRAAIERHRRRQFAKRNGGAPYTFRGVDGKHGWANRWLPRNPEIVQPAQNGDAAGKLTGAIPIVKQAIALVSIVIAFGLASTVAAQQRTGREITASTLKQQLLELESNETRLRLRLEELEEELKPESIERELAGIGSVHPEKLREHRRKLLTIERNGLQTQLDLLEEDRARIEAAIAAAGTAASLEDAQPSPSPLRVTAPAKPITEIVSLRELRIAELPLQKLYVAGAMFILLGSGFILLLIVAAPKGQQWFASTRKGGSGFQTHLYYFSDPLATTEAPPFKSTQGVQS